MSSDPPGSIWCVVNDEDRQIREVYARYGLAMYHAQVLEHAIVNTLLVIRFLPTIRDYLDRPAWEAAFDQFYAAEFSKTFGNVLKGLELLTGFPSSLVERLRSAKVERDYLAHRFFRDRSIDFVLPAGRTKMIVDCERLIDLFKAVDSELEAFTEPQWRRFGISAELVNKHMILMEKEARAVDGRSE